MQRLGANSHTAAARRTRDQASVLLATLLSTVTACTGEISDPHGALGGGAGSFGLGSSGTSGHDPLHPSVNSPSSCGAKPQSPPTRLARLTHAQYDNTVRELLGLDVDVASSFLRDPTFAGFDNSADNLIVADRLGRDYRRAAEELAAQVVASPSAYAKLVPCDASTNSTCARTFVTRFLRRAFRRPPTTSEIERYLALHGRGTELVGSGNAFVDGVQLVVEAALQSPSFLYRTELSRDTGPDGYVVLSDHEIAVRLSYALWDTLPDDVLDEAADRGELDRPARIEAQARRMLDDPRAHRMVASFHRQWLDLAGYEDLLRDPAAFPLFTPDLAATLQAETLAFVTHVVFDRDEGLATLLTAPYTFVNARTAPLYGLSGSFGDALERVDLDPGQRSGLLTQLGFLASHAFYSLSSPIHRGVFIHRRILCTDLPDPPGDADLVLPPVSGHIKTTRQQVEVHTSPSACSPCHGVINPVGFAFEHYDAVGQYRTTDHDEPVDASGELTIDKRKVSYRDAIEFTRALADSDAARTCYAKHWLRFLYGRPDHASDACTLEQLSRAMRSDGYSVRAMLTDLTQTHAFLRRAPEASP